jgi:hypothetical protein
MEILQQVMTAMYVALAEAAGPGALNVANKVLRDALDDGVINDPRAIALLRSLAQDTRGLH